MLTRRTILAAGLATALPGAASARATLGEDGLYKLDWYLESFLDLGEDVMAATAAGKRFAILWGLKGCPACRRMHEVHLADPQTERYIRENFEILHLNILGQRPVTDFDGTRLGEKAFAARYAIEGTPSIQFFPETTEGLASRAPVAREVARMPSLPDPAAFLALFRAVREKRYQSGRVSAHVQMG
ncbi:MULTISPECIES: thioredoxin family protein [Hyphomicrobiales]|jgi:thioredoxin-related protein|uniref:thioredoxin family protein n=1 Tax=Methylobacterium sp. CCH7-A2 TaxID=1768789 RepID=UPI000829CE40|nr:MULTISPECIES: thioredoxin family protein [Hyphomicrobiales]